MMRRDDSYLKKNSTEAGEMKSRIEGLRKQMSGSSELAELAEILSGVENYEKIYDWIREKTDFIPVYPESYDDPNAPGLEIEHHVNPYDDSDTFLIEAYIPIKKPCV